MTYRGRARFVATILSFAATTLGAQEEGSLDELFSDPVEDTILVETGTDHLSQYVTEQGIKLSGSFSAEGGVAAGWTSWPVLSDPSAGFDGTIGLTSTVTLAFDARPDPDFRLYGTVTTSMDPLTVDYTWNAFSIDELFIDYTWVGDVFIRMGQHDITWGQARLFESITDIMADAAEGFSLRANLPTVMGGVSVIGMTNRSGITSYRQIVYAAKVDEVVLETMLSLGVRYQVHEGLNALLSVKRVLWGVDLLSDVVVHYDESSMYPRVLAGFFKEWPEVRLYGEYYYDGSVSGGVDHTAGLVCGFNNIAGTPLDLGLQWMHAFIDNSGSATAGLTWKPWKYITATLALPVAYGADDSRYVTTSNSDIANRRIVLVFGIEMSVSF
ncbi:MAG: hypothetical protein A2Y38_00145 [Spirochaetes bacterium GWB1_59_5]|nr:MAG: hypothetical protein A2Y38_00145 [Spirochaetes bacterium GWB1_59_5]